MIIIGLGNPGITYANSWHNVGFSLLNLIAKNSQETKWKNFKAVAEYLKIHISGKPVFLLKPQKYMNNSGIVVNMFANFYKISPQEMLVCYDDADLDLGVIRIRKKGSAGGHRGMEDIISHLGTNEFARMRIGVGPVPGNMPLENFVLSKIPKSKMKVFDKVLQKSSDAVSVFLNKGICAAMNEFNSR